jgi:hypothetical protein
MFSFCNPFGEQHLTYEPGVAYTAHSEQFVVGLPQPPAQPIEQE